MAGRLVAARLEAATAADAAALAAAPVTFAAFGARGSPSQEAARFASLNGARLVGCRCPVDRSWRRRTVEVVVEREVELPLGRWAVRSVGRAEFVPLRLLSGATERLLAHPRVSLSPAARADLEAGRVDGRVVALLGMIAERHSVTVGVLVTGHAKYVRGTDRISHHHHGRAVDISAVDGEPVSAASPSARRLVTWLASLEGPLRPSEVGSPFADLGSLPGFFTDADHRGHVHIGYRP